MLGIRNGFVAAVLLFWPAMLLAQGTVTIYGTVTDPSGAAIAGAKVTVTNTATDQNRETVSAVDGNYVVPDLRVGTYRLSVTASGFKTFVQESIQVQVDENRRVPVQMAVGGVNESVTVAADVAQVETRSSALRQVVDSARIIELPLNGRNPLQLQYLVAGSSGSTDPAGGQSENTSVSIDGMRANSNNYSLDGADNQDPFFNTPSVFPNPDALEEFSLQTSNYSAELGRNAGAVMNAVTRSGSNSLRGTVFEFLRNQDFDAISSPIPSRRSSAISSVGRSAAPSEKTRPSSSAPTKAPGSIASREPRLLSFSPPPNEPVISAARRALRIRSQETRFRTTSFPPVASVRLR